MSDDLSAFLALHAGLPRQGPGLASDVEWACALAEVPLNGVICDAGCGPGADLAALAEAAPEGRVTGIDLHMSFVGEAALRARHGMRVMRGALIGRDELPDPVSLGPFDLIWCAGAMYFEGIGPVLDHWRHALRPGGAVAFSYPVTMGKQDAETRRFWEGAEYGDDNALDVQIAGAGWGVAGRGRVSTEGWAAYHEPLLARAERLKQVDVPDLRLVIEETIKEVEDYRRLQDRVGYALRVVRPA
ncbi:MAG: class I SAM-dependent methyltransferase [Pseudomonadota bacterium]